MAWMQRMDEAAELAFRRQYVVVLLQAKGRLRLMNELVGQSGEWPAGQEWASLGGSSRAVFMREAREVLGIDDDTFLEPIREGRVDVQDLYELADDPSFPDNVPGWSEWGEGVAVEASLVCDQCGTFPSRADILPEGAKPGDRCPAGYLDDYDCDGTLRDGVDPIDILSAREDGPKRPAEVPVWTSRNLLIPEPAVITVDDFELTYVTGPAWVCPVCAALILHGFGEWGPGGDPRQMHLEFHTGRPLRSL